MLTVFLFLTSIVLLVALIFLFVRFRSLKGEFEDLRFRKSSLAVKYGKMTEQFIPFIEDFPHDPKQFRFLGNPIDGVLFDDDQIVFCEFKTGSSSLNENQRRIKRLVNDGKVSWLEFKIR